MTACAFWETDNTRFKIALVSCPFWPSWGFLAMCDSVDNLVSQCVHLLSFPDQKVSYHKYIFNLFWIRKIIRKLYKFWGLFIIRVRGGWHYDQNFHFCSISFPWEIRFHIWESKKKYLFNMICSWLSFYLRPFPSVSWCVSILSELLKSCHSIFSAIFVFYVQLSLNMSD